jgi:hypothetical protein
VHPSGDTSSLESQLFQQQDGEYLLVLWRAYDATNPSRPEVTVALGADFPLTRATMYTDLHSASFDADGAALPFTNNDETLPVGTEGDHRWGRGPPSDRDHVWMLVSIDNVAVIACRRNGAGR